MVFKNDIPSVPFDTWKDSFVRLFDLNSMQDATERFGYRELVEIAVLLDIKFTFPLEHLAELLC